MSMNCLLAQPAAEGVRTGPDDLDVHELSDELGAAVQVDDPELRRASGNTALAGDGVDEDRLPASHEPRVPLGLEALLPSVQDVQPAALLLVRHVVLQPEGG